MQCPLMSLSSCCCYSMLKPVLAALAVAGVAVGILSAGWPGRSIGLYQWIMERFNWRMAPIDLAREIRNTRVLGVLLTVLSLALFAAFFLRCS